jgi:N-acetylglucosaminyldiphosphoundecaprenol N-acetyl-beta-D-mannosaminyltransferase
VAAGFCGTRNSYSTRERIGASVKLVCQQYFMATPATTHAAPHRFLSPGGNDAAPDKTIRLAGARFAAVTEAEAVEKVVEAARRRTGLWTITANLDHLRRYCQGGQARELIDEADMVVADGMCVIWASRLAGAALPERVAGSSMIWAISEVASSRGQSVFLLGGNAGVADRAAQVLRERYERLDVVGSLCPPVGFEEDGEQLAQVLDATAAAKPDIVFVALGFPKQDLLIRTLREALPHVSFVGVGIGLSFVTGDVVRAPLWVRDLGMEWLFRLLQEPGRLARRYLLQGIPFAMRLLAAATYRRVMPNGGWGRERNPSSSPPRSPAQREVWVDGPRRKGKHAMSSEEIDARRPGAGAGLGDGVISASAQSSSRSTLGPAIPPRRRA